MPDKPITIRVLKTVEHEDGSPRWRVGTQIHTTREELKDRGVPESSYTVITPGGGEDKPNTTSTTKKT